MTASKSAAPTRHPARKKLAHAPLVRQTLQDQLYQRVRDALAGGSFLPGESVTIRALAEQFETSTMPVRGALRRLVSEASLEMLPNRTVRVPPLSAARLVELCRIRGALECLATELAAPKLTNQQILRLDRACDDMEAALDGQVPGHYLRHHRAFHFGIYMAADSPLLLAMIENTWVQLGPYLHFFFGQSGVVETPEVYHREIVAALRARDGEGAAQSVARDVQSAALALAESDRLAD
jgi:DNA-binding GntR family transcriptional regulator